MSTVGTIQNETMESEWTRGLKSSFPFTQIGLSLSLSLSLSIFLSVAVDRFAPSHGNRMRWACSLLRYGVAYRVASGCSRSKPVGARRRLQPCRAVYVDFFVSATTWFEVPCELYFFQSFFFWRVVYSFFSLLDGPSSRSCCSGGPHVCRSTRRSRPIEGKKVAALRGRASSRA